MEEDVGLMALAKVQGMQSEVEAIEEQFASLVKSSEPKSVYQAAADMHLTAGRFFDDHGPRLQLWPRLSASHLMDLVGERLV